MALLPRAGAERLAATNGATMETKHTFRKETAQQRWRLRLLKVLKRGPGQSRAACRMLKYACRRRPTRAKPSLTLTLRRHLL